MTHREFETYFKQLYLPLGMYAMRIVGNADDAEDIVENAFIKAWQVVESGSAVANFKSFIYASVRNECISFLRSRKEFVDIDEAIEVDDETIDTSMRDARIWGAIDGLPPSAARCF